MPSKAQTLLDMSQVFGKDLTESAALIYVGVLQHFTDEQVSAGAIAYMRSSKWFPKPAELIDAIKAEITNSRQAEDTVKVRQILLRDELFELDNTPDVEPNAYQALAAKYSAVGLEFGAAHVLERMERRNETPEPAI